LPKELASHDRLFIWQSSPAKKLVALAELKGIHDRKDRNGRTLFDIVYLTPLLEDQISIAELRQFPSISNASFLKSGPFATVFPLTNEQGETLFRIVAMRNPDVWGVWPDVEIVEPARPENTIASSVLEPPSRIEITTNRIIRDTVKTKQLKIKYGYRCQVCGERIEIGKGRFYAEVHHICPLGGKHRGLDEEANMIVLCPNHHAMFDFGIPRFLSNSEIEIGRKRYKLSCKHTISQKSVRYHNEKLFGNNP